VTSELSNGYVQPRYQQVLRHHGTLTVDCWSSQVLRILVPKVFPDATLSSWAEGYRNATGVTVMYTQVDFLKTVPEVDYEVKANVSLMNHAGWLLDPAGISLIGGDGGLADLGPRIKDDPNIDWNDITPFFRDRSSVFDRKIVAVPLDGDLLLMYYRADVLAKHDVSVPQTWEDFVTVAAAMNGTDFDNDGEADYSVCMDRFTCAARTCASVAHAVMLQWVPQSATNERSKRVHRATRMLHSAAQHLLAVTHSAPPPKACGHWILEALVTCPPTTSIGE
jgi:hypothetical protein